MTLLTLELFSGGNEEMCPRSLVEKYTMPYVLVRLRLPEELFCLLRDVVPVPAAHPLHQGLQERRHPRRNLKLFENSLDFPQFSRLFSIVLLCPFAGTVNGIWTTLSTQPQHVTICCSCAKEKRNLITSNVQQIWVSKKRLGKCNAIQYFTNNNELIFFLALLIWIV